MAKKTCRKVYLLAIKGRGKRNAVMQFASKHDRAMELDRRAGKGKVEFAISETCKR